MFAHLTRILPLGRLRLRGPCGAQFEFAQAAIAQNLGWLAKGPGALLDAHTPGGRTRKNVPFKPQSARVVFFP